MNWDRIAGKWQQLRGAARQGWGRFTGNYAGVAAGMRQQMLGKIQGTYGISREANEKRLAEWRARQHKSDPIHK